MQKPPDPVTNDESIFLHDISTPLATANLAVQCVLDDLQQGQGNISDQIESLETLKRSLERINKMVNERKSVIG